MALTEEILTYIKEHQEEAFELLLTLGTIPAPSNHEEERANFCKEWLDSQGAQGVYIDEALNVIYPVGVEEGKPVVVFMAHTDVVFPDTKPLPVVVDGNLIKAPGIGDDTANLCNLLMAAKYIAEKGIKPVDKGMLLIANAGEEGLGNLKGSRAICRAFGDRVEAFYSFDGYMGGMAADAVGSKRYQVEVLTEGGHSYGNFGSRNAIYYMASLIETLYAIKPPVSKEKTTYNVGTISGGTSVNTIAQQAAMLYEFRSDSREDLKTMEDHFRAIIESYRMKGIKVNVTLMGERPCGQDVDEIRQQKLTAKAAEAIEHYTGKKPRISAGSTDCNIPLSQGIPSICLGTCTGGGAHTREEWVEKESLEIGCRIAFELILSYFNR